MSKCEIIENGAPKDDCGIRPCLCHLDKPDGLVEDIMTALSPVIAGNTINSSHEVSLTKEIERTIRGELEKRIGHPLEEIERIVKPILLQWLISHSTVVAEAHADRLWNEIENGLIASTLWPVMPYPNDELLAKLRNAGWAVGVHNDYRKDGERFTFWLMTHPSGIYFVGEGRNDAEALAAIDKQARKVFQPSP